jgi:hypothetical protein
VKAVSRYQHLSQAAGLYGSRLTGPARLRGRGRAGIKTHREEVDLKFILRELVPESGLHSLLVVMQPRPLVLNEASQVGDGEVAKGGFGQERGSGWLLDSRRCGGW